MNKIIFLIIIVWFRACRFTPHNYVLRRKPSGFSLVAFCRYCIIEAVFLLIPPPWLTEVLNSTAKIVASERPRTDVVPLRNEFDILLVLKRCTRKYNAWRWLPLQSLTLSKNWHPCQFLDASFLRRQKTSLLFNTNGIRAKNLYNRRVHVRTVIFCEICIILILIPYEQYTYTTSSIFLRCNTLCRIYLFCPCLVRCFDCYHR